MINANELRIGNYLEPLFIDKPFCIVKGVDEEYIYSDCISTDYTGFDEFKPIILTEEWLLNMGFEIKSNAGVKYISFGRINKSVEIYLPIVNDILALSIWQNKMFIDIDTRIKYVHELQTYTS